LADTAEITLSTTAIAIRKEIRNQRPLRNIVSVLMDFTFVLVVEMSVRTFQILHCGPRHACARSINMPQVKPGMGSP
jgi:hypothetical protein